MTSHIDHSTSLETPSPSRGDRMSRRLFSFPVLLCVLLGVVAVWSTKNRFNDPDLWWHLKVGQMIWQTGELPNSDTLSYTTGQHAWVPHQWLSEVVLYGFYSLGGYQGLMLWLCLMSAAILISVYGLSALHSRNAKVALAGGLIAWFFATIGLAIRPLLIGQLLLVVTLALLYLGRARDRRWLWGLPAVFALWVNCHGSFALGLAIVALHNVTSRLEFEHGLLYSKRWSAEAQRTLLMASVACGLALLINPVGLELATYPLNLFFAQADNLNYIDEWRPLDFSSARGKGVFLLTGAIALLVMLNRKKLRLDELALLLVGLHLTVQHSRMLFVFGVIAAPIFCRLVSDLWRAYDERRDYPRLNAAMIAGGLAMAAIGFPSATEIEKQVEKHNPIEAVSYIREEGIGGRMLNHYAWGGYLIWALPEQKVFIDGRTDIFDWTGVLGDYMRWWGIREEPLKLLEDYEIDYCLLSRNTPVARLLRLTPQWREVYSDDKAAVFVREPSLAQESRLALGPAN